MVRVATGREHFTAVKSAFVLYYLFDIFVANFVEFILYLGRLS